MTTPTVIEHVTCLGCGCACDDIAVVVQDGRIVEARNTCPLGDRWFSNYQNVSAACRVEGRDTSVAEAIASAGSWLHEARRPLVYLAPPLSSESQRAVVSVADILGARLDTVTSATTRELVLASQERGWASATLGEIRNRADLIVVWGADLSDRYPRFASRYAPDPVGTHVPNGRASRTVIALDVGDAGANCDADHRVAIDPADEVATLEALAALAQERPDQPRRTDDAGAPWATARELFAHMIRARYVAIIFDAEPDDRVRRTSIRFDALISLAQTLNDRTRCAAIALRAGGNRSGADSVLVAQTGYPFAIDFSRGFPRYDPYDGTALAVLQRGETDLVFIVGDASLIPREVAQALGGVRCVVMGPAASASALGTSRITIDTGADGIHASGTALRMDDVPLPLRATVPGSPSVADLITALATFVRQRRAGRIAGVFAGVETVPA